METLEDSGITHKEIKDLVEEVNTVEIEGDPQAELYNAGYKWVEQDHGAFPLWDEGYAVMRTEFMHRDFKNIIRNSDKVKDAIEKVNDPEAVERILDDIADEAIVHFNAWKVEKFVKNEISVMYNSPMKGNKFNVNRVTFISKNEENTSHFYEADCEIQDTNNSHKIFLIRIDNSKDCELIGERAD